MLKNNRNFKSWFASMKQSYSRQVDRPKYFLKRLLHLFFRFYREDHLNRTIYNNRRKQPHKKNGNCELLFGTLTRCTYTIRQQMTEPKYSKLQWWQRNVRPFRGQFCRITREFNGYSQKELCNLLNAHPEIASLSEKYAHFMTYYPFSPKFIEDFENNISKIMEYCSHGLLFGMGFPTDEFLKLVSHICGAEKEHQHFQSWCFDFQMNRMISNHRRPDSF